MCVKPAETDSNTARTPPAAAAARPHQSARASAPLLNGGYGLPVRDVDRRRFPTPRGCPDTAASGGLSTNGSRGSRSKIAWVPLPWCTSNRRSRCVAAMRRERVRGRHRDVVEQAKPIAVAGSAWCPGGRTAQNARRRCPSITQSVAATTAPAARATRPRRCRATTRCQDRGRCRSAPGVSSTAAEQFGACTRNNASPFRRRGLALSTRLRKTRSEALVGTALNRAGAFGVAFAGVVRRAGGMGVQPPPTPLNITLMVPQHFAVPVGARASTRASTGTTGRKAG